MASAQGTEPGRPDLPSASRDPGPVLLAGVQQVLVGHKAPRPHLGTQAANPLVPMPRIAICWNFGAMLYKCCQAHTENHTKGIAFALEVLGGFNQL